VTETTTWIPVADAAHIVKVPAKTAYRWALRDDVRRIVHRGRVLVVLEDVAAVRHALRGT